MKNKHEYLESENFYEWRSVGTRAKSDKTCEHCGQAIYKDTPHKMAHFYPEFYSYPVHEECTDNFLKSLN